MATAIPPTDLRATLDAIGETAHTAQTLVAGLGEAELRATAPGGASCRSLVIELIAAGNELGRVAHDVLGHVPGATDGANRQAAEASDEALLRQLHFLREHIVSTVDQQGAAVWSTPTPDGEPLFAHAVALRERDMTLLADLASAATAARRR